MIPEGGALLIGHVWAMFLVGLMGAGHCVGMCGGIAAALGGASRKLPVLAGYNLGRISSYTLVGLMAGLIGGLAGNYLSLGSVLRMIAGTMLVLMGLYIADIWKVLTWLERAGQLIWRHIQPLVVRGGQADSFGKAIWLGMLWGWLPCGLVYSALGYSRAAGSAVNGAFSMLAFGVGTLPAMFVGSWFSSAASQWMQKKSLRRVMGCVLVFMGLWTVWIAQQHAGHGSVNHHSADGDQHMESMHKHHHE